MEELELAYPTTKLVYWTMPLSSSNNAKEALRSQFNQNLRLWIASQNNKVLFDIADIEAWNANGQHQTFTLRDVVYEKLESDYTSDGGHLNKEGSKRAAIGLYSLFGKIAEKTSDV
jgi:hypothetical protein